MPFRVPKSAPLVSCGLPLGYHAGPERKSLKCATRLVFSVPLALTKPSPRPSDPISPLDKEALKQLALLGGLVDHVEISSSEFADLIASSQQTASRRILELVSRGLIEREMGVKKQLLKISLEGMEVLKGEAAAFRRIFELSRAVHIRGLVSSGVGEGKYYISQEGYTRQFEKHLDYVPFAGTLNVELQGPEVNKLRLLKANPGILIERFTTDERTFGEVYAWRATIGGEVCAAILPKRSHYTRVLEIIAPQHLRSRLGLEDGSPVEIEVEVPG